MAGLFRNVTLTVTNPVHIPLNVYSNTKTWGTYVGTVSEVPAAQGTATAASAVIEIQTNVLNESGTTQQVTLTTQIVDAAGNVVVTAPPVIRQETIADDKPLSKNLLHFRPDQSPGGGATHDAVRRSAAGAIFSNIAGGLNGSRSATSALINLAPR